jgi:hypothetical protein
MSGPRDDTSRLVNRVYYQQRKKRQPRFWKRYNDKERAKAAAHGMTLRQFRKHRHAINHGAAQ